MEVGRRQEEDQGDIESSDLRFLLTMYVFAPVYIHHGTVALLHLLRLVDAHR